MFRKAPIAANPRDDCEQDSLVVVSPISFKHSSELQHKNAITTLSPSDSLKVLVH